MKFLEEKFVPLAAKIGSQKHLLAIRDTFLIMMPLTIVGAIGVLLACIGQLFAEGGLNMPDVQAGYDSFINNTGLIIVFGALKSGTIGMVAILMAGLLSYNLTKVNGGDGLAGFAVAVASFLTGISINTAGEGGTSVFLNNLLGADGLFVSMLVGLFVGEVFPRLSASEKLKIKMPADVPLTVAKSFSSLLPAIIIAAIIASIYGYTFKFIGKSFFSVITSVLTAPLQSLSQNVFFIIIQSFMINILWIFGLHGTKIVDVVTVPILSPLGVENMNLFAAQQEPKHTVVTGLGTGFVNLGGAGGTIGCIIAILIFSKSKATKTIGQSAAAAGIFEINEPLIFGVPIVMNVVFAVPFIIGPIVLGVMTYCLMEAGMIRRPCITTPSITPPVLIGFLCTGGDIRGAVWNVIEIVFLTALWTPFILINDKIEAKMTVTE